MAGWVEVGDRYQLWFEDLGGADASALLLVMGANASSQGWPDELVALLAQRHRVVRYDHRDTGRSTWAFDERPYEIRDLADDAISVLDALGISDAHVVGMSMGGVLAQLMLLDHPDRLRSATLLCTTALGAGLARATEGPIDADLPGPDPRLLEMWAEMGEPRGADAEMEWRIEHWRILNGDELDFDPDFFRTLEERSITHAGRTDNPAAHARAGQGGLERGAELAAVQVPTLVVEAPADPINPPPHASHLASMIPGARLVTVPAMGHALSPPVLGPLASAILAHTSHVGAEL